MTILHRRVILSLLLAALCLILNGCGPSQQVIEVDGQPTALALDRRGTNLLMACPGVKKIIAWHIQKRKQVASQKIEDGVVRLATHPLTEQVMLLNRSKQKTMLMTWPDLEVSRIMSLNHQPSTWYHDDERNIDYIALVAQHLIQPYLQEYALPVIPIGLGPEDMIKQTDAPYLWVANEQANEVAVVDLNSNLVIKRLHVWANPYRLGLDPQGNQLFVLCLGKQAVPEKSVIQIIDLNYQTLGLTWPVGPGIHDMAIDPKGRFIFLLDQQALVILSLDTGEELERLTTPGPTSDFVITPDGAKAYIACPEKRLVAVLSIDRKKLIKQ